MIDAKKILESMTNLNEPILTEKLAPKLAPFAKIIYYVALAILALSTLSSFTWLFSGNLSMFVIALFFVVAEFALVRMFCEYLAATAPKAPAQPKADAQQ